MVTTCSKTFISWFPPKSPIMVQTHLIHHRIGISIDWQLIKSENVSPKRQFHTANIQDNNMFVFGGGDGKMWLSDLYKFNLGKFLMYQ